MSKDWQKRFNKFWEEGNYGYNHIGKNTMKDFIRAERKRIVEEIDQLLANTKTDSYEKSWWEFVEKFSNLKSLEEEKE